MKYVLEKTSKEYELMGGKGTALSKIGRYIDNIPDWFVISFKGFDIENKEILESAKYEIEERLKEFEDNTYFAVRSSAGNEDSSENSFAGQFDTFLYVRKENILEKVKEVYMSAFSDRIETYRKETNQEEITIPSVIVQKQINSEVAGVAFSVNPVNSNIKETVISAVYGLGSSLVDGVATPDTYIISEKNIKRETSEKDFMHVLENGEVVQKGVEENKRKEDILTDDQILEIKELVKNASEFFGRFQDIEWAYEKRKIIFITVKTNNNIRK